MATGNTRVELESCHPHNSSCSHFIPHHPHTLIILTTHDQSRHSASVSGKSGALEMVVILRKTDTSLRRGGGQDDCVSGASCNPLQSETAWSACSGLALVAHVPRQAKCTGGLQLWPHLDLYEYRSQVNEKLSLKALSAVGTLISSFATEEKQSQTSSGKSPATPK